MNIEVPTKIFLRLYKKEEQRNHKEKFPFLILPLISPTTSRVYHNLSFFNWLLWHKSDKASAPFLLLHQLSLGLSGLQSSLLTNESLPPVPVRQAPIVTFADGRFFQLDRQIKPTHPCLDQASVASKPPEDHQPFSYVPNQLFSAPLSYFCHSKELQISRIYARHVYIQELIMTQKVICSVKPQKHK